MAMSFSGAVLTGMSSSFHNGGAKQSVVGSFGVSRKTQFLVVAQRKKSLIYAAGDGNILDDLNDATKKASDFVTDKTKEAIADGEKAKDYVVEKTTENNETLSSEAKKAADYVTEKGREAGNNAADLIEGKAGDAKDATK